MKLQTNNYTIEDDSYGYRLTVTKASNHAKSKTGFTTESTFHANLHQVAAKMMHYELAASSAGSVESLADHVSFSVERLLAGLELLK